MALPSLAKTWQFRANQTVAGDADITIQNQNLIWQMYQDLIGAGSWVGSDGSALTVAGAWTNQASSGWGSAAALTWAASEGTTHSWVRLRQTGVASTFEMLWTLIDSGQGAHIMLVKFSHSGFTTGGTSTNSPTGSNTITMPFQGYGGSSNASTSTRLHTLLSTDGKDTRIILCRSSKAVGFLHVDVPPDAPAGWTNKYCVFQWGNSLSTEPLFSEVFFDYAADATNPFAMRGVTNAGANLLLYPGTDCIGSTPYPVKYQAAGSQSAGHGMYGIKLAGAATGHLDPNYGPLPDLWYGGTGRPTGDAYPSGAPLRQFAKLGPFIYPWMRSSPGIS